ncbi:hypothetical protein E2C01_084172 [Portunus trituberculatus]|uniref:Uncharacterized protein n=1 Tax=Portunus trituberculatus TaxID=210409 RepID=A0A5B7J3A7_PORTR|nr:hypothetical protein [Portunus trituberculatus]
MNPLLFVIGGGGVGGGGPHVCPATTHHTPMLSSYLTGTLRSTTLKKQRTRDIDSSCTKVESINLAVS